MSIFGRRKSVVVLGLVLLVCSFSGCRCRKTLPPPVDPNAGAGTESTTGTTPFGTGSVSQSDTGVPRMDSAVNEISVPELRTVYFDYDKYVIRADDEATLKGNVAWLRENAKAYDGIKVEGHCDERGTDKYNMVLSERRANSVRDFLIKEGIPGSSIIPVAYGEAMSADPGHTEASWAKNRRAEFKIVVQKK